MFALPMETVQPPMRIALFGMSADPPHRGHGEILQWLAQHFDHVAVWASDNPFKDHQSPLPDRIAMLRLMIRDIPAPAGRIQLHEDFSHRRSLMSVYRARDRWPDAELTLVVGADLVKQLPRWYKARELFQQVKILVVPRPGYDLSDHDLMEVRQQGGDIAIAEMPMMFDLSSTYYRQTDDADALPAAVKAYIDQNNLYPCAESSREKQPIS
jgi:nicotinate-nucleotide adenylyltransferase